MSDGANARAGSRRRSNGRWPAGVGCRLYHRVSDFQVELGLEVLDRLELRGDETVLDAGCGTGRVTRRLVERLPRGRVVAVDASEDMVRKARESLPPSVDVRRADLSELELEDKVDGILSTAVFHWIPDHEVLFARLGRALLPGGRLAAQCGGEGNVSSVIEAVAEVREREPFAPHLSGWTGPWYFASPEATSERLERAGFRDVRCWLEPRTLVPEDPGDYLRTVTLGLHLKRLPEELHDRFVDAVVEQLGEPVAIDYVRLNIDARRP